MVRPPKQCIETKPTTQTVVFGGTPINLSQISRRTGMTVGALSRIFRGDRTPSLRATVRISGALGMSVDSFLTAWGSKLANGADTSN